MLFKHPTTLNGGASEDVSQEAPHTLKNTSASGRVWVPFWWDFLPVGGELDGVIDKQIDCQLTRPTDWRFSRFSHVSITGSG